MKEVLFILFAYLIGSIPTAVWISRYFFGVDIRDYGSGNAGATNTFRVLGKKAGIPVFPCLWRLGDPKNKKPTCQHLWRWVRLQSD